MAEKFKEQAVIISQEELAPAILQPVDQNGYKSRRYAKPGQFISIYCEDGTQTCSRVRSASAKLIKRIVPCIWYTVWPAQGTEEFSSEADRRSSVSVMGPLGNGFPVERAKKHFLIGGGIGVPPMLELAKQLNCEKQIIHRLPQQRYVPVWR